jgi:hypothetical protein
MPFDFHELSETASTGFVEIAEPALFYLLPVCSMNQTFGTPAHAAKFGLTACLQLVYSTHQFPIMSQQIVVLRRSGRLEELAPHQRCSKMLSELSDLQTNLQVWVL